MNSKLYQILMIVVLVYICGVAMYITWGLYQIQTKTASSEWFYYTMNDKVYKLKIADTLEKQTKGLSNLKSIPSYDGMIFMFKDKKIRGFWNQGLNQDLDILWLDDFVIIGKTQLNSFDKKGLEIVTPDRPVNYAIELFK